MFFVLHILLLTIYVSEANNFDRKEDSGDVISDVKQNDSRVIFQGNDKVILCKGKCHFYDHILTVIFFYRKLRGPI